VNKSFKFSFVGVNLDVLTWSTSLQWCEGPIL